MELQKSLSLAVFTIITIIKIKITVFTIVTFIVSFIHIFDSYHFYEDMILH